MTDREALLASIERLDKWTLLCGLLVALGVGGEFVVGYFHWVKGNALRALEETEAAAQLAIVTSAKAQAEEAALKVANATLDVETARREAALAQKAAADATLRLEQFKAPRRLNDEQRASLLEAMRKFSATKFDMGIQGSDREASAFANAIEAVLLTAGWVEVSYVGPGDVAFTRPGKPVIGMINLEGVWIQTHQQAGDPANAAVRLAEFLNGSGVKTTLANGSSTNLDGVHVYVGKKAI